MKLKKMEIVGFKSFCDKAVIKFPHGISAIVGPNGCGKSNVVDALRWAMGEQSVKQLRGKSREDIIFAGTDGKHPMNMAEVSLTLSNDNGSGPPELKDFTEIMLTRRLYRSGETSYLINRQPCRLKDIHNIFLGSGMGARSYAIIQQGNIGAITEAGPEERRTFIEEAAGVTRYKTRKKEALRKLDATQQNLLRLQDIITEVERQMKGLKRQAGKAERHQEIRRQIKKMDIRLCVHQFDACYQEIQRNNELLRNLKDQDLKHTADLKKLDAAIEAVKLQRTQKNEKIAKQKSVQFEQQRQIDRMENDLSYLRKDVMRLAEEASSLQSSLKELESRDQEIQKELAEYETKNKTLQTKIEAAETDLAEETAKAEGIRKQAEEYRTRLEYEKALMTEKVGQEAKYRNILENVGNTKDQLKRRLKKTDEETALAEKQAAEVARKEAAAAAALKECREEIESLNISLRNIRQELTKSNAGLAEQVKAAQTFEFKRSKVRSRFSALKKMADSYEWYRDGVKAVMKQENADGRIIGLLADVIEPEAGYETAAEAVLGESLQYILVKDQAAGQASIDYLETHQAGRSGFIPFASLTPLMEKRGGDENKSHLLDHISVKQGFETVAETLLGHVFIADDLDAALNLYRQNGKGSVYVTPGGAVISERGVLIGGSRDKLSGILMKKRELKSLETELAVLDEQLQKALALQHEMESRVKSLETELHEKTEEKNFAVQNEMDFQKTVFQAAEEIKHARRHLDILRAEQEQLLGESDDLDEEIEKYQAALADITDSVKAVQNAVAELSGQIDSITAETREYDQRIMDLKLNQTSLKAELDNNQNASRRLKEFQADSIHRLEQLKKDVGIKQQKKESAEEDIQKIEQNLLQKYDEMRDNEKQLAAEEADYQEIETLLNENDRSVTEVQGEREAVLQKIRLLEVEQSQQQLKQDNIAGRVEDRYHRPLAVFRRAFEKKDEFKGIPPEEMETSLKELREKLDKIGPVNLGAIDEYRQLTERFDFLNTQRDDLLTAMEDLHKVIKKINRITQELLMDTFNKINEKIGEVFPQLFQGGSARLVLTEPNKPLETGVEFMVHPPGKKLTRLSLLSGGEKALSAIAFVFSIFLIKPASFCIMDEIDAPLDEANVFRFNELLKIIGEKSQIIMITHKKKSMEFADILFGITMEQKGESKVVSVNFQQGEAVAV